MDKDDQRILFGWIEVGGFYQKAMDLVVQGAAPGQLRQGSLGAQRAPTRDDCDIAILFTDIRGSTALYQRIGDLNAFQLVQQHFDLLRETTVRHGGAIVKTIGDAVMAAYPDAAAAVGATLDMLGAIERFNKDQPERPVLLKIGIHHGAAIAVTLNEELDYFGQTVNIASRVQEMADAAEIWITEAVWHYPGVEALLEPYSAEPRTAEFHGIEEPMTVVRIGSRNHAVARSGLSSHAATAA